MRRLQAAVVLGCAGLAVLSSAEPPPYTAQLSAWARQSGYVLSDYRNCTGLEEKHFGSMGSVCWQARQREPEPGTALHPRIAVTLAVYRDEAAARERMTRFRTVPESLTGEARKLYPLRAGFQVGTRVLVLTTDALAFVPHLERAAAALSALTHGTAVTCWQTCAT